MQDQIYTPDKLAKIFVDHVSNEKGEILARVWENPGFREIYDFRGNLKDRRKLKRKQEQVFNQFDSQKHLFQKIYYNPALLQDDEVVLRNTFVKLNDSHELTNRLL